jgi:DNA-binding HxlR family transcriptional regulator
MLTRRLRELETAGLVERRGIAASPVRVEYHLTQMGREAGPVLDAVIAWSHTWIPLRPAPPTTQPATRGVPEPVAAVHGTGRPGGREVL